MSKRVKRKSNRPEAGITRAARRDNVIQLPVASRLEVKSDAFVTERHDTEETAPHHDRIERLIGLRGALANNAQEEKEEDDHAEVERFFSSEPPAFGHHDTFHDLAPFDHHEHDP